MYDIDIVVLILFGGGAFILGILMHYIRKFVGIRTTYKMPYPASEGRFVSRLYSSKNDSFWVDFVPEYSSPSLGVRELILDTRETYIIVEFTRRGNYVYKLFKKVNSVQILELPIDWKQYLTANALPMRGFPEQSYLDGLFPEMLRRRGVGRNQQRQRRNPLTSQ